MNVANLEKYTKDHSWIYDGIRIKKQKNNNVYLKNSDIVKILKFIFVSRE